MSVENVFNIVYLQKQLKRVSEMRGDFEAGKYYINFVLDVEQKALFELLLAERIQEMETLK